MGKNNIISEDALTQRMRKIKRKKLGRNIRRVLVIFFILIVLILKYVIGIAYYNGESFPSELSKNSYVIYLKPANEYESSDLIIYKDITENKDFILHRRDYDKLRNSDKSKKTKILGKIIWKGWRR